MGQTLPVSPRADSGGTDRANRSPGFRPAHVRPREGISPDAIVFLVLLGGGLALRAILAYTAFVVPNSDEATGMIMALRASQGHPVLVFLGQNYGGALLSYIEGALIAVFGFHMRLFWIVDTALTMMSATVLWVTSRYFLKPIVAASAGGLFFFFSPLWIRYSSLENVFYDPGILLSLTAAWLVLRWFDDRALWTIGLAGLCAGLAIWCTAMTACLLVPPALVLAWGCRRRPAHLGMAAAGFLLGVSPWIAFFAMRGRSALRVFHTSESHWTVFRDSVVQLIPVSLGSGTSDSSVLIGWSVFLGSAVCLAVFLARRHFELACCAASIVLWPFLVVASGVTVVPAAYRYAFLISGPLAVLVCYLASLARLSVILALFVLLSVAETSWVQTRGFAATPACDPTYSDVREYLDSYHRTAVWGSYWVAGVLAVCQYPRLAVGVASEKGDASWAHEAAAAPQSTYVVYAGQAMDKTLAAWTALHDREATRTIFRGLAVWLLSEQVSPQVIHLQGDY